MTADAFFGLVRAHDHRRRVPSDEALDSAFDVGTARHERLLVGGNRVDVWCVRGERQLDAVLLGVERQLAEQTRDFLGAAALKHIIERVEPLASLDGIEFGRVLGGDMSHGPQVPFGLSADRTRGCRPITYCNLRTEDREPCRAF